MKPTTAELGVPSEITNMPSQRGAGFEFDSLTAKGSEAMEGTCEKRENLVDQSIPSSSLSEFRRSLRLPPIVVPEQALQKLVTAASTDSGGGEVVRYFLFWLAGQPEPSGFTGEGGLELRRLDGELRAAALEVFQWWSGPTQSDQPLYEILGPIRSAWEAKARKQPTLNP